METNSMYDTYTAAGGYCHKCGTYIGGASHIWYVNGNQPVCEVCLKILIQGSTQPLNVGAGYKAIERVQCHCPVCGEEGEKLRDWVHQTGDMSALRDVVLGSKHIYACPKCHCLFWEEA